MDTNIVPSPGSGLYTGASEDTFKTNEQINEKVLTSLEDSQDKQEDTNTSIPSLGSGLYTGPSEDTFETNQQINEKVTRENEQEKKDGLNTSELIKFASEQVEQNKQIIEQNEQIIARLERIEKLLLEKDTDKPYKQPKELSKALDPDRTTPISPLEEVRIKTADEESNNRAEEFASQVKEEDIQNNPLNPLHLSHVPPLQQTPPPLPQTPPPLPETPPPLTQEQIAWMDSFKKAQLEGTPKEVIPNTNQKEQARVPDPTSRVLNTEGRAFTMEQIRKIGLRNDSIEYIWGALRFADRDFTNPSRTLTINALSRALPDEDVRKLREALDNWKEQ